MKVAAHSIPRSAIAAAACAALMSATLLVTYASGESLRAHGREAQARTTVGAARTPTVPAGTNVPRDPVGRGAMNSPGDAAGLDVQAIDVAGSSLVAAKRKLGNLSGDPGLALATGDLFGSGVARLGDVDGDGVVDVAVGARGAVGATPTDVGAGAVWVLLMNANGTVKSSHEISAATALMSGMLHQDDNFGRSVAGIGDVNGDGIPDLAVGAPNDDDLDPTRTDITVPVNLGAIYIILLNNSGNAIGVHKISDSDPGLVIDNNSNQFGFSIAPLGDLDGPGGSTFALAVGAKGDRDGGSSRGAVQVLFMHYGGGTSFPIDHVQKISDTQGTPATFTLHLLDLFGSSVSAADVNGDGIPDLAVGAPFDDDGGVVGTNRGAVYVMNLARDGTATAFQKITGTQGGFTGILDDSDFLGDAVEWVPDLDGNGVPDLMVGATGDDDGFSAAGAVWALLMNSNGTVKRKMKISETVSPLNALGIDDNFGAAIANLGDVNGDGLPDLLVGTPGDDDGAGSAGAAYRVLLGRTATALTMPTTYCNDNLVITVTVTPAAATGSVELFEGASSLGTHTLASGQTTYTLAPRAVGSYPNFSARYYGDDNDLESTSPAFTAVVSLIPMTASVVSNHNPRQVGLDVTFTATITNAVANSLAPTGTVEFFDGATSLGSSPLSGGTATFGPTTSLTVGDHSITAVYGGDGCHATKTSGILTQTITKIPTTTSLASDLNPSNDGDLIHLTATVLPAGASGDVEFFDGATSRGTATLSAGSATLSISTLSTGTHSLTAKYLGDPTHEISTSAPVSQVVRILTTTALSQSPTPAHCSDNLTLTATVAPSGAGGTAELFEGATSRGTVTLSGGHANFALAPRAAGIYPDFTAVYSGDATHAPSTSLPFSVEVSLAPTVTVVTSDHDPQQFGLPVTFTATVSLAPAPALAQASPIGNAITGAPADGSVVFYDGVVELATAALSGGTATSGSITNLSIGDHPIKAIFRGSDALCLAGSESNIFTQHIVRVATTTSLASDLNPSNDGDLIHLTAGVLPAGATGDVEFFDGAASLGTVALATGSAVLGTSSLSPGTHSLTAHYLGDATHDISTSAPVSQVVRGIPGVVLEQTPAPAHCTDDLTFTATMTPSSATGTVELFEGATSRGTTTIAAGQATFTVAARSVGSYPGFTAHYGGDADNAPNASPPLEAVVSLQSTSTHVTSSQEPQQLALLVTLTATVAPATATGTVQFFDGATSLGSSTLGGGSASFDVSNLTLGAHAIKAVYAGDACNAESESGVFTQHIVGIATTTSLASDLNPSNDGDLIHLTAGVLPAGAAGNVEFFDGAASLGTRALAAGSAVLGISSLSPGTHSLTAHYLGDATHDISTSAPLSQVVKALPGVALAQSPLPAYADDNITLIATVTPSSATGTVELFEGVTSRGTQTLVAGQASFVLGVRAVGTHPGFTAVYSGDASNAGHTSSPFEVVVSRIPTSTLLESSLNPSVDGQPVTLTATVSNGVGSHAAPTGLVRFFDGATLMGQAVVSSNIATFGPTTSLTPGTHSLTAEYDPDATHELSTSAPVSQVVKAITSLALAQSPNPAGCSDNLTLTATVTPPGATGTVELFEGATSLGTMTLSAGHATFSLGTRAVGSYPGFTAVYAGDAADVGSTSPPFSVVVSQTTTTTSLASSQNPQLTGLPVTFTATVIPASASGTVDFFDGASFLGRVSLDHGSAEIGALLVAGPHPITAVYSGDLCYSVSTSSPLIQVINPNLGPNLCTNGGFESGLGGWEGYGSAALTRTSPGRPPSSFAGKLSGPNSTSEFGLNDSPSCVTNTGPAGSRYRVSAWVRSDAGRGAMRIRIREYNGGSNRQTVYSPTKTLTTAWQELVLEIVTLRANSSFDLQVLDHPTVTREMFLVDDVAIQLVPAGDRPPVVVAPAAVTVVAGTVLNVDVTASDSDGPAISSLSASPFAATNPQTFVAMNGNTQGRLTWTPTLAEAGNTYTVTFTAQNVLSGTATTAITVVAPPPPSSELCGNGTFNTDLAGWIPYEIATLTMVSGGRSGSALQARTSSNSTFGIDDKPNWIGTVVGRGAVYRFTAWVKSASHHGSTRIRLYEYLGSTQQGSTAYSNIVTLSTSWQKLTLDYVVRTAGSTLSMRVTDTPAASSGETFLVDDVSITLVSPPVLLAQQPVAPEESVALEYARPVVYPNPARGTATLGLSLAKAGALRVELYDVTGRVVRVLADEAEAAAGTHRFALERERGAKLGAGIYFYRAEVAGAVHRGRLVMLE